MKRAEGFGELLEVTMDIDIDLGAPGDPRGPVQEALERRGLRLSNSVIADLRSGNRNPARTAYRLGCVDRLRANDAGLKTECCHRVAPTGLETSQVGRPDLTRVTARTQEGSSSERIRWQRRPRKGCAGRAGLDGPYCPTCRRKSPPRYSRRFGGCETSGRLILSVGQTLDQCDLSLSQLAPHVRGVIDAGQELPLDECATQRFGIGADDAVRE